MHELGIASSILEGVAKEMRRHPGCRPAKVGIRIGRLAAVDPAALQFAFDALVLDTELRDLKLDTEFVPSRALCRDCNREFEFEDFELKCPACASGNAGCIGGDELEFSYMEVEEDEPCTVGRESTERECPPR